MALVPEEVVSAVPAAVEEEVDITQIDDPEKLKELVMALSAQRDNYAVAATLPSAMNYGMVDIDGKPVIDPLTKTQRQMDKSQVLSTLYQLKFWHAQKNPSYKANFSVEKQLTCLIGEMRNRGLAGKVSSAPGKINMKFVKK